jgi:hypothetical protein
VRFLAGIITVHFGVDEPEPVQATLVDTEPAIVHLPAEPVAPVRLRHNSFVADGTPPAAVERR